MIVNGESESDFLGFSVGGVGDLNNDAFCDFAISLARFSNEEPAEVLLYYGGWSLDSIPDMTLGEWEHAVGLAGGGDVNGDSCSDMAIGVPHDDDGKVLLYWGGEGFDGVADAVLVGEPGGYQFGHRVDCTADVDRDGDCEVLVGTYDGHAGSPPPYNGKVFLFAGGSLTVVLREPPLPDGLVLEAFPNPVGPLTTIFYRLSEASPVEIAVYTSAGHMVKTLLCGRMSAGSHFLQWNARAAPPGLYLIRLRTSEATATARTIVAK
jgi:hypothetical protein